MLRFKAVNRVAFKQQSSDAKDSVLFTLEHVWDGREKVSTS